MKKLRHVLGISGIDGYTHDNSIAVLKNGEVLFAASEERYSRIKHDSSFPSKAIAGALSFLKLKPSSFDTVAVGFPKRKILSVINHKYFYEVIPFTLNILVNRNIRLFKDFFSVFKLLYKDVSGNKYP